MSLHIDRYQGKRVHMIGIGGSSMSGLGGLLRQRGYHVSGSDQYDSYTVRALREQGIAVAVGQAAENVHGSDLVIYSAAIAPENPERQEASRLDIPQMERSVLLGQLMQGYEHAIAIAGTHGKTTTTAMVTQAIAAAGLDPAAHLGGNFDFIGGSTRTGSNHVFVAEACEFHASFLQMRPTVALVLNIEEDHLDYYRDLAHITETFGRFLALLPQDGLCIANGEDARAMSLLENLHCRYETYGMGAAYDWHPHGLTYNDYGCGAFDVVHGDKKVAHVSLQVGGDFNVTNALAAMAAAHAVGAEAGKAAEALSSFKGVHRRLERTGAIAGVRLYHDYGHNPVEMRGALSVIKKQPHNRLWAVMQPHTYSRVKRLFPEYIHCCEAADEILITDIFAAREADPGDINSQMLVDAIEKTGQHVHLTPTFDDTEAYLRTHWQPGDVVLTMGCGNINELNEQMQRREDGVN